MGAFRAAPTEKADALRANRAVKVGAFRDVRTEKAGVFLYIVAAFRANGFKKRGLLELTKLKKGGFGGGGTYPYCLAMGVPPPGL